MKPVKGMNLDVSPDSQPQGTYRHARNWTYDAEFDGLAIQAGNKALTQIQSRHISHAHMFENGDIVALVQNSATDTTNKELKLYNKSTDTWSNLITGESALQTASNREYQMTTFRNRDNERLIIITDGQTRPIVVNVDGSNPAFPQQYLFPDRTYPVVALEGHTTGSMDVGSYFFTCAYEMEDGTRLDFGPTAGPFRIGEDQGGMILDLTEIDTAYEHVIIGMIAVIDGSIQTGVVAKVLASSASAEVYIDGTVIEEVLLEQLAIIPTSYTTAKAIEFHDNRLYLGNVQTHQEDTSAFQGYANQIQPIWEMKKSASEFVRTNTSADPTLHRFMPDEVYAFYVAWVREDGTYTRAYHIPGRPPSTHGQKVNSGASGLGATTTRTVNETDTLETIIDATGAGEANEGNHLGYLRNDRNIFDSSEGGYDDIKFFHTRATAKKFTDATVSGRTVHHGEMSYWENENETYPTGFPNGKSYTWNADGLTASASSTVTLAGENVRHHRFPSLSFMFNYLGSTFDFDSIQNHGFQVRFEFVTIPSNCKGAVIYHAKRTGSNNTVLAHTPIHFGAANTFAFNGEGGSEYRDYSIQSVINSRNANSPFYRTTGSGLIGNSLGSGGTILADLLEAAGDPKEADGTGFDAGDYHNNTSNNTSTYDTEINDRLGVHYNKALSHDQVLLENKPTLPSHMYTRLEYMLIQMEKEVTEQTGYPQVSTSELHNVMRIYDSSDSLYFADVDFDTYPTEICAMRRFRMDFTNTTDLRVNQSFAQSEVLPCRNMRYMPGGVIDDEVKFDNRRSPEALYWEYKNITNTATPYTTGNHHNAGDRLWYSVLNSPNVYGAEASGDTDNSTFTHTVGSNSSTQTNRMGYHLDTMYTGEYTFAVMRLPFVSVNAMRMNCYLGYNRQDLVACTPVMAGGAFESAPTIGGSAQSTKRVPSTYTHGDIHHSSRQYRVFANAGFTIGFSQTDYNTMPDGDMSVLGSGIDSLSYTDLTDDGTRGVRRGGTLGCFKVNTLGPLDSYFHNKDKEIEQQTEHENLRYDLQASSRTDSTIDLNLTRLNDWIQPDISDGIQDNAYQFDYRIARSRAQENTSDTLNFRSFAALDFFEQPRNRGSIQNLQTYADKLLIHQEEGLFVTVGNETLSTSAGAIALGSGDIFRVKPTELVPTNFGYAGTQHPMSCLLTPRGYFWVDAKRKQAFLYNGKIEELSNKGLRSWFQENMELDTSWYSSSKNINGFHPGLQSVYDPKHDRIMLLVRKNTPNTLGGDEAQPGTFTAYLDEKFEQTPKWEEKDEILSYSFLNNAWVSFHDYNINSFLASANQLYGITTFSSSVHVRALGVLDVDAYIQDETQLKISSSYYTSWIDVAFPAGGPAQWQSFSWMTRARREDSRDDQYGLIVHDDTFEKAAVYNDYQCSGDVTFVKASDVDVTNVQRVTLRNNGTHFQFNGFRDLVDDRTERFLDPDYNFVTDNLNTSKDWYDQRRFKSTHAVLRLQVQQQPENLLYLYEVDAKVRKAYR